MERRFVRTQPAQIITRDDGTVAVVGYASVFYNPLDPGTEFQLYRDLVERIMPGAFDRALREDDVRGLFNHDSNQVLGRTASGTLKLSADEKGLRYEISPPNTQLGRDLPVLVQRGDVSGSSFAFTIDSQTFRTEGDHDVREINAVTLYDVGPVTYPAYESTTAGLRCAEGIDEAVKARDAWRAEQARQVGRMDVLRAGLRLKELEIS